MTIPILYCGSGLTQQLFDKVQKLASHVLTPVLLPSNTNIELISALAPKGIIITGSPQYVNDPNSPRVDEEIYGLGIPILGICYGMQLMAANLGGTVKRMSSYEKGLTETEFVGQGSILFQDFAEDTFHSWMVHTCKVTEMPEGFVATSKTKRTEIASFEDADKKFYGTQFHPEHRQSQAGSAILWNFLKTVHNIWE
jgi:GMP synthase (glutamine-hydrolysing)